MLHYKCLIRKNYIDYWLTTFHPKIILQNWILHGVQLVIFINGLSLCSVMSSWLQIIVLCLVKHFVLPPICSKETNRTQICRCMIILHCFLFRKKTIQGIITVENDRNALYFLKEHRFIQIHYIPPTMKCKKEISIWKNVLWSWDKVIQLQIVFNSGWYHNPSFCILISNI